MTEIVIVGISTGLILVVSTSYRGSRRVPLLRVACVALFVAMLCRDLADTQNTPALDLLKSYAVLVAAVSVVKIFLTFRVKPLQRWQTLTIYGIAAFIALGQLALAAFLPVHPDGTVLRQAEIGTAPSASERYVLIAYQSLYLGGFILADVVAIIGCWRSITQRGQALWTRISTGFILAAALGSSLFIASSILDVVGRPMFGGSAHRSYLVITVISFLFLGLSLGVLRRVYLSALRFVTLRLAHKIVHPLWQTSTRLHPGVRLSPEDHTGFNGIASISRLTIETHDALRLIREDTDPALAQLHRLHPSDPELSAALLRHLGGEKAVPRLSRIAVAAWSRALSRDDGEALTSSLTSLFEIRLAIDLRNDRRI